MTATLNRREVDFKNLDEILADAERLVSAPNTQVVGHWPLTQLLTHLAMTFNSSIKGPMLRSKKMKPGIKLPKKTIAEAFPAAASPTAAFESLRKAIARTKTERMTAPHPAFGKMTHEEWNTLHLRHAELHLSFAIPGP
jgi:Protein of unknown function (DUF1569)